jgi:O-antigen ligase
MTSRRGLLRWLAAAALCLGIVFTLDRLHWVAMMFVLLAAVAVSRKPAAFLLLCAVAAAALLLPPVRARLAEASDPALLMTGRDVLWRGAALLLPRHPVVGFGPRTFTEIFPLLDQLPIRGVGSWHNDYLQVYMESGLLGLVPLLWVIGATYRSAWRVLRSGSVTGDARSLVVSLLLALTTVFLFGGMRDTLVGIEFRVLLGLFALLVSAPERRGVGDRQGPAP